MHMLASEEYLEKFSNEIGTLLLEIVQILVVMILYDDCLIEYAKLVSLFAGGSYIDRWTCWSFEYEQLEFVLSTQASCWVCAFTAGIIFS